MESWNVCKTRLLREYFPLFVKEKMIRELVVFNFQEKGRPMREFIKEVTDAAEFLQNNASEADGRVLTNLHPDILAQAALLPRPVSFQELRYTVGLKRGWQCCQRDSVLWGRQPVLRDLIDLVEGVTNREDQLLVANRQTEGKLNGGNATDGDIFRKTVSKEILLGP